VAQLHPQAPSTHFSRLLRHAWATAGLFFSPVTTREGIILGFGFTFITLGMWLYIPGIFFNYSAFLSVTLKTLDCKIKAFLRENVRGKLSETPKSKYSFFFQIDAV
jgi:hypothetical protein